MPAGSISISAAASPDTIRILFMIMKVYSKLRTIIEKSYRRVTQKGTFCVILSRI